MTFLPNILETTSILHVTLLVFLRLLAVIEPMTYKEMHIKFRHTSIVVIWIMSIVVQTLALITQKFTSSAFFYYRYFMLYVFHTFPIFCVIIMYFVLIHNLKKRNRGMDIMVDKSRHFADSMNKKMTTVVKRIVLALLICYIPFLTWEQYYLIIAERIPFTIYPSEVRIYSRIIVIMSILV